MEQHLEKLRPPGLVWIFVHKNPEAEFIGERYFEKAKASGPASGMKISVESPKECFWSDGVGKSCGQEENEGALLS